MLRLKNIKKDYIVADTKVHALKGIDLSFRKNEFVSILGPSGCGKTTLLNIIGGLDKYTEGDLFINGRSTKEFTDRDWDVYRNHRIGFIFQSYNLIPHQTILGNVELALTISGVGKAERQERAKKALDKVGLAGQYNKKPNQLSGGQCQRVAIARALVNEPEILLADEPTGALDTVTSVQIMDLIKEIAQEKLVIMVTHNPELAEKYSTRIVRLLDGELQDDTNPFSEEDEIKEVTELANAKVVAPVFEENKENVEEVKAEVVDKKTQKEKAKMSLWTAFKLSAKNLHSKLKRTIMVIIAGSIGISGVSAVLAVSQGVTDYIESIQDDLLSGNPIQITKSGIDYETLMNSSSFTQRVDAVNQIKEEGKVNVNSIVEYLVQNQKALDSLTFQNEFDEDYVSYVMSMPKEYYNTISMRYGMSYDYNIYADYNVSHDKNDPNYDLKKEYNGAISLDAINSTYSKSLVNILKAVNIEDNKVETYSNLITTLTKPLAQSINFDSENYIREQYDLVRGHFPGEESLGTNEREVMLVLDNNEMVSDLMLAQLGYYSQEEFFDVIYNAINESNKSDPVKSQTPIYVNKNDIKQRFSYDELLGKTFRWYPNDTVFKQDSSDKTKFKYDYNEPTDTNNMITLKVTGILKLKEGTSYGALKSGFVFSEATSKEMIRRNINSNLNKYVRKAIEDNKGDGKSNANYVVSQITYDLPCYWESINQETGAIVPFSNSNNPSSDNYNENYDKFTVAVGESDQTSSIMGLFTSGGGSSSNFSVNDIFGNLTEEDYATASTLAGMLKNPADIYEFIGKLTSLFSAKAEKYISNLLTDRRIYVKTFGGTYLPNSINVYPTNFEIKDKVTDYLSAWNKIDGDEATSVTFNTYNEDFSAPIGTKTLTAAERKEIKYTDTVGLIIGLINTMINIVTYALVAFTALSLIVSTVMIAIITYVSVMERVKEIGVIRSLGGRKKDVSHLFNAEAFIIGAISGIFGVVVTYILQIIGNIVINALSGGVVTAIANLTPLTALIMILISILLTAISGLLPARSAAKKDPVVALRTE